jgi:alkylated DNA repair dioxygenase AlkB
MQQDFFLENSKRVVIDQDGLAIYYPKLIENSNYFQSLYDSIYWEEHSITIYGQVKKIPRLSAWFCEGDKSYSYSGLTMKANKWPKILQELLTLTIEKTGHKFNACLVNYYRDGSDYVAWHADDEVELGKNPVIASLSFGETRRFVLKHKTNKGVEKVTLDLEDGDLLLMKDSLQKNWNHQLSKTAKKVGGRISLTFRYLAP